MFAIIGTLLVLSKTAPTTADTVEDVFTPAVDWIARWLPLFYVPLLVTIPLSIQTIPVGDLAKVLFLVVAGMVASLIFTAQTAVAIRATTNTELLPQPPTPALPPFSTTHYVAWGAPGCGSGCCCDVDWWLFGVFVFSHRSSSAACALLIIIIIIILLMINCVAGPFPLLPGTLKHSLTLPLGGHALSHTLA